MAPLDIDMVEFIVMDTPKRDIVMLAKLVVELLILWVYVVFAAYAASWVLQLYQEALVMVIMRLTQDIILLKSIMMTTTTTTESIGKKGCHR